MNYDIVPSPLGQLVVLFSNNGICRVGIRVLLTDYLRRSAVKINSSPNTPAFSRNDLPANWKKQLKQYFEGKRFAFDIPLDLLEGTEFSQKVWQILQDIPCGQVRSYRQIAKQIGAPSSCRAVGMANSKNPVPIIIPCHRVIKSDGSLGGYSSGADVKKTLLLLEKKYLLK